MGLRPLLTHLEGRAPRSPSLVARQAPRYVMAQNRERHSTFLNQGPHILMRALSCHGWGTN